LRGADRQTCPYNESPFQPSQHVEPAGDPRVPPGATTLKKPALHEVAPWHNLAAEAHERAPPAHSVLHNRGPELGLAHLIGPDTTGHSGTGGIRRTGVRLVDHFARGARRGG